MMMDLLGVILIMVMVCASVVGVVDLLLMIIIGWIDKHNR